MILPKLFLLFAPLCAAVAAQGQFDGPESIEHDAVGQRYFISNTGDNSIKQQAYDGTVTPFVSGLDLAPYGIEMKGDTLFACMGGEIRGFSVVDAQQVFVLDLNGSFLNGLATDGHFLYATDFSTKKIFKVDPSTTTFTTLVANTLDTPNGIVWDVALEKLWVACWGSNAKIKSYDRDSGTELSTYTTALANLDGIALDCLGRIVVSSWSPARLSIFDPSFTLPPITLQSTGLSNPADIDMDTVHDLICYPNSGDNSVGFAEITDCSTGMLDRPGYSRLVVHPNPYTGLLTLDLDSDRPLPFLVFNMRGTLVASGTLSPKGQLDIRQLAQGTYVIEVPSLRKNACVVRQ